MALNIFPEIETDVEFNNRYDQFDNASNLLQLNMTLVRKVGTVYETGLPIDKDFLIKLNENFQISVEKEDWKVAWTGNAGEGNQIGLTNFDPSNAYQIMAQVSGANMLGYYSNQEEPIIHLWSLYTDTTQLNKTIFKKIKLDHTGVGLFDILVCRRQIIDGGVNNVENSVSINITKFWTRLMFDPFV